VGAQLTLFSSAAVGPQGLRYQPNFISTLEERDLTERIRALPLAPFQVGAFEGKRRVASFGWRYDYSQQKLEKAEDLPAWIEPFIARIEAFARTGEKWERFTFDAQPRSLYMMAGASRHIWEHSIPPVERPRYSITFRTMAEKIDRGRPD